MRPERHDGADAITKESIMSRSSLMTALALFLTTTTASAAKTPAKMVVHEGDSLQAAIDAASPGTTIVVEPASTTTSSGR